MQTVQQVMAVNNDLPIKTDLPVHSGKVRSVYCLSESDSKRLIKTKNYALNSDAPLAIMVISDRISAFECIWRSESGLKGVPGKGAALNAISNHWFQLFKEQGLADSHIVDIPHPLVWIVQKAQPIMIEAIARQYITGSMWRDYQKGERNFCGNAIPDGLQKDQKLPELLITPSSKGILKGIPGVPEVDDVNISRDIIEKNYQAFKFKTVADISLYEKLLSEGFASIGKALEKLDQIFVDTKFEFGYVKDNNGNDKLIYMDEVGTPDSSRIWDGASYRQGKVIEKSKEQFRQALLNYFPDPDILTNKDRMTERTKLAKDNPLPDQIMYDTSNTYRDIAEKIIGKPLTISSNPKQEIIDILSERYQLIK